MIGSVSVPSHVGRTVEVVQKCGSLYEWNILMICFIYIYEKKQRQIDVCQIDRSICQMPIIKAYNKLIIRCDHFVEILSLLKQGLVFKYNNIMFVLFLFFLLLLLRKVNKI